MVKNTYFPPEHAKGQFHCPHCSVFAKQRWSHIKAVGDVYTNYWPSGGVKDASNIEGLTNCLGDLPEKWSISICEHCEEISVWLGKTMIYPKKIIIEAPNADLEGDIKADYLEAANILNDSPRASAAVLRLALQKLCKQLGESGKNINHDIGELVKKRFKPKYPKIIRRFADYR